MADLHLHTTASDGAYTPAEVAVLARKAGLNAFAITDHDTLAGYHAARTALIVQRTLGRLDLIPAVELTAEFRGRELHLLGYFVDPDDPELTAAMTVLQTGRIDRFAEMIRRLRDRCGIDLGNAVPGPSPGRLSVARLVVKAGKARTEREAFGRFLRDGGPADVPKRRLPVAEAIAVVRGAGGVAGWAHPPYDDLRDRLAELADLGLQAIEAEYPTHGPARAAELRSLAAEFGLIVTGGSDCHGAGPPSRSVGGRGVTARDLDQLRRLAVARPSGKALQNSP